MMDDYNQSLIHSDIDHYNYGANQALNALSNYNQLIQGNYGGTTTSTGQQNKGGSTFGKVLGGALGGVLGGGLSGYGLGGSIGSVGEPLGTDFGTLAGGLLDFFRGKYVGKKRYESERAGRRVE